MKRIAALLALTALTSCRTDRPPAIGAGPVTIQGFDALGNPTSTSYAGRTSAGAGQVSDTTEAGILIALAEKIKPGDAFAYAHIVKSDVVQPDVDLESKTDQAHKDALQDAAKAMAAGAAGNYSEAAKRAADLGAQLIQLRAAKANAPKPDSGANSTRLLAVGPDSGLTTVAAVATYGAASQAKQRASYGAATTTKSTDTTGPTDIASLADAMRAARLQVEAGRTNIPQVIQVPVPMPTPLPAPVSTNTVETIQLPVVE